MLVRTIISFQSEVELKARINELEKQLAELQEEHSQLKAAKGTSDSKHGAHRHDNNMSFEKENYDGKLKATESLNHQLKEEVMKLQLQNRDAIQKLDKCKKNLSLADDGIQNERKAKEDSQEKVRTLNEMLDRHKNAYTKVTHEKNELRHQVQESNEKVEALEQVKQQLAKLVEVKDSALQEKREDLEAIRKELDETKSR